MSTLPLFDDPIVNAMPGDLRGEFESYCVTNKLTPSQAMRIAFVALRAVHKFEYNRNKGLVLPYAPTEIHKYVERVTYASRSGNDYTYTDPEDIPF